MQFYTAQSLPSVGLVSVPEESGEEPDEWESETDNSRIQLSDTETEEDESLRSPSTKNGKEPVKLKSWGLCAMSEAGYQMNNIVGGLALEIPIRCAIRNSDLKKFAAKDGSSCSAAARNLLKAEYELLQRLQHPSIIEAEAFIATEFDAWILREWCYQGCSWSYVRANGALTETHSIELMQQLVEGIYFLHMKELVHLGLEPGNLLLTNHAQTLKIGGFSKLARCRNLERPGSKDKAEASHVAAAQQRLQDIITLNTAWAAPESIYGQPVDSRADTWSCALCVGYFMFGRHVFAPASTSPEDSVAAGTHALGAKRLAVPMLAGASEPTRKLLKVCLSFSSWQRPFSCELRLHPMLLLSKLEVLPGNMSSAMIDSWERKAATTLQHLPRTTEGIESNSVVELHRRSGGVGRYTFQTLPNLGLTPKTSKHESRASKQAAKLEAARRNAAKEDTGWKSATYDALPHQKMTAADREQVVKAKHSWATMGSLPSLGQEDEKDPAAQDPFWQRRVLTAWSE